MKLNHTDLVQVATCKAEVQCKGDDSGLGRGESSGWRSVLDHF